MKTYRISSFWRKIIYSVCTVVIIIYGGLAIMLLLPENIALLEFHEEPSIKNLLAGLFLLMVLLMLFLIVKTHKTEFVISNDGIKLISLFKQRKLKFKEIKGFEVKDSPKISQLKFIGIESNVKGKKAIVITNLFEKTEEIRSVLSSKLIDIDAQKKEISERKIEEEKIEILSNQEFGFSKEEREEKLKKAKLTAKILNVIGAVTAVWVFFFPRPYQYAIIACVCLPILTLIIIKAWKGLIKIDSEKNSAYPSAPFPVVFPGLILSLRAMRDFSIDDYSKIWIPAILIAIFLAGSSIIVGREISFKTKNGVLKILGFLMFSFAYGYGTVVTTNCAFDKSEPKVFQTKIVDKQINGGKYRSYDLYLSPWDHKTEVEKVSIDRDLFNNLNSGEEISIYQFKGKFDIPWIVVGYAQ